MTCKLHSILLSVAAIAATFSVAAGLACASTVRLSWQPSAQRFWQADARAVVSLFHNGQCTMWAQERRPGIVRRGIEAIVSREIAGGRPENVGDWDARYWPSNARRAGISTGHAPRAHALMVFQPGVLGAGASGHIAYVQRVDRNGSFVISEMHAPTLWRVTRQRMTAADGRLRGVTFIY
jgi:hypothetical protein